MPVAIHEYMHLLVRHSGLKWPIWLNEGFADVYSTLQPSGGKILLGAIPLGRAAALEQSRWMPFQALVSVAHDSPEYNEKNRAGLFYAQSWLTAHMMLLGNDYRDRFPQFAAHISNSGSTEESLKAVYGKSLGDFEKDVRRYFNARQYRGALFDLQFEKFRFDAPRPATSVESGVLLARIAGLIGRTAQAEKALNELSSANPKAPEPQEALAYLFLSKGDVAKAGDCLRRAIENGNSNWQTHWDFARTLSPGDKPSPEYETALRKTLELNPELIDARLELARAMFRDRRFVQALALLGQVKRIDPENAPSMFLLMAYSAAQADQKDEARKYADLAIKHARTPDQTADAQRLSDYLKASQSSVAAQSSPAFQPAGTDGDKPTLRRAEPAPATEESNAPAAQVLTVAGRLTKLDCIGQMARLHVRTSDGTLKLLIRKPDAIVIRGSDSGAVNLTCGPQDANVFIEFVPHPDAEQSTVGDVATLEFRAT